LRLKLPGTTMDSGDKPFLEPPEGLKTEKLSPKVLDTCWLSFLDQKFWFSPEVYKRVLLSMDQDIFPNVSSPLRFADFLTASFNLGGIIGLLALTGLFTLMTKYNLEEQKYYTKLYSLVTLSVFQAKYRQKFLSLLNLSLLSSHLPGYLVAAFLKRLARISLYAPPYACSLICALIFNFLQRHPSCQVLLHRPSIPKDDADENTLSTSESDPFKEEEVDPAKCDAIQSSLWEIKTLCNHYCAPVSRMANLVFEEEVVGKPPRPPQVIEDFLGQTYSSTMETELKWHKNLFMPLAFQKRQSLFHKDDVIFNTILFQHGESLGDVKPKKGEVS